MGAGEFETSLGPVFTTLLLADEINRAPAKMQCALLEVMQERQVTIGRETFAVPDRFRAPTPGGPEAPFISELSGLHHARQGNP